MNARACRYFAVFCLAFGAHVRADDFSLQKELRTAALEGDVTAVRELVARGADPNSGCPLIASVRRDNVDTVLILLKLGANVDCRGGVDNAPSLTPLNMALTFPRVRSARVLVASGANVNAVPPLAPPLKNATSPLQDAIWNYRLVKSSEQAEWLTLIEEIIQHGADLRYDSGTLSVLGTALLDCRATEPIIPLLLKYGADPNQRMGRQKETKWPLEMALSRCSDKTVRLLLEKGANPVINGDTRAMVKLARAQNREVLVPLLVQHGATDQN
jgi:ankyrin repeat protein